MMLVAANMPGASDGIILLPRKDTLIKYLIEPLEKYGFMMVQNIITRFCQSGKADN